MTPASDATAPLTFVFLHYWPGSGREWQAVVDGLHPDYPCLTPNLGGFGGAPLPVGGCSVQDYANEIARFIADHRLTRYALVGHSMGGKIALTLAAREPQGLVGLALLSPSPPQGEPMTQEEREKRLHNYGDPQAAAARIPDITGRPLPENLRQQIIDDNVRSHVEAYSAWLLTGSREDISAQLAHLHVPVTLLVGTKDAVLPPNMHQQKTLPWLPSGTPLHLLEGVGHLQPLEAPEEVVQLLRAWATML